MASMSVMPVVNGRKRPEFHAMRDLGTEITHDRVGEVLCTAINLMSEEGIQLGVELVTLEVKFF